GLIRGIWSRAGLEVGKVPFERGVFPIVLYRPIEVRGRVLELYTDVPIAGARVSQAWKDDQIRFGLRARLHRGIPSLQSATTDAKGEFRALVPAALRKGQLLVEADGFLPGGAGWEGGPPGDFVEVRLARVDHVPRIRGRVSWADGRPAPGVRVKAGVLGNREPLPDPLAGALIGYSRFLDATQSDVPTATTDGVGGFLLPVPCLGTWQLFARLGEGGLAEAEVEVREALQYPCEIRPAADAVTFLGTVRERRSGRPIAVAAVHALLMSLGEVDDLAFRQATLRTEENGAFRLGPVLRRPYALSVRASGFAPASLQATPGPEESEQSIVVEMDEECRLRGRVVDEEGRPVAGALVYGSWEHARADERGLFEIGSLPADVDIRFSVTASRDPGEGAPRIVLVSDPLPTVRFAVPGEERDLGRVIL
ncbi:MAG: carboxypeptidase-like regulatory domain-containing protein, partial [Planctomycetota bacterium]